MLFPNKPSTVTWGALGSESVRASSFKKSNGTTESFMQGDHVLEHHGSGVCRHSGGVV